jgi:type I restriction enzyme S subunit
MQSKNGFSELPQGWVWTKLEDCADILDNRRIPVNAKERETRIAGKQDSELCPYYGATGQVGWIDGYLFDEELLLVGEDGAPFLETSKNKAYVINGKSWVNNHAHVLKAIEGFTSNSFLVHYLNIFDYHGYVTGTTRFKLNQPPMRKIPIPLAPFQEQLRIVGKVEELFSFLDAGTESLRKVQAQLKRYRQAVLKYAFEGKLTEEWRKTHKDQQETAQELLFEGIIRARAVRPETKAKALFDFPALPESWAWTTIGELATFIGSGITPHGGKRVYVREGVRLSVVRTFMRMVFISQM